MSLEEYEQLRDLLAKAYKETERQVYKDARPHTLCAIRATKNYNLKKEAIDARDVDNVRGDTL